MIFLILACLNYKSSEKIKEEIVETPYGYTCRKISSGKNWSAIECWESK